MEETHSRVSAAIWSWRDAAEAKSRKPSAQQVLVRAGVGIAAGLILYLGLGRPLLAGLVWAISVVLFVSGFLAPAVFRAIEKVFLRLGQAAGAVLTWLLLAPVFYVVFGTGRLILALLGKDPMKRQFPTTEPTYWEEYQLDQTPARYRRQH